MKKLIVLLLALLILLVGCKSKDNTASNVTEAPDVETEATVPVETMHPALTDNPFDDNWTDPVETEAPAGEPEETEAPKATEPPKATEEPTQPTTTPTVAPESGKMDYDKYMSMSAQEQSNYMNSFESIDAFFAWYNAAKAEHDAQNNDIEIGNGSFDLGELEGNG